MPTFVNLGAARVRRASAARWSGAPRAKRATPERDQQQAVVKWLRIVLPGAIVQHVKNEAPPASSTPQGCMRFHAKRKADGLVWGFPDLIVNLTGGGVCYIEMKAPITGVLSAAQQGVHAVLRVAGHRVGCATCIETARFLFHEWGIPLREAAGQPMRPAVVRLAPRVSLAADAVPFT